ncbi:MAG: hypothetical protein RLZZ601_220 [Pseudomonadota bacterium]|jgi:hypothetical protein
MGLFDYFWVEWEFILNHTCNMDDDCDVSYDFCFTL